MAKAAARTVVADQTALNLLDDDASQPELGTLASPEKVKVRDAMSEGLAVYGLASSAWSPLGCWLPTTATSIAPAGTTTISSTMAAASVTAAGVTATITAVAWARSVVVATAGAVNVHRVGRHGGVPACRIVHASIVGRNDSACPDPLKGSREPGEDNQAKDQAHDDDGDNGHRCGSRTVSGWLRGGDGQLT